ncbi:MAG: hypothetical protein OHK0024_02300 [Thalassobaculales bacterium]
MRATLTICGLAAVFGAAVWVTVPEALPIRHDSIDGYGPVKFGMTLEEVRLAVGEQAMVSEVCGDRQAVTAYVEEDGRRGHMMAFVDAQTTVKEIEITFADNSPADSKAACFADLERMTQMQARHYADFAQSRAELQAGTARARRSSLVFPDGSAMVVMAKYWPTGGTCYTTISFRAADAPQ